MSDGIWHSIQQELDFLGRRMRGLAMISRGIVPNLVISQQVVNRILEAAKHHLEDETGETMVGLLLAADDTPEAMPTIVVLDTIAPDDSTIRRSHMFEQGDELQGDIFVWLLENWDAYLQLGKDMNGKPIRPEWRVPLRHIGDWHKQPGYMIQPSGGDLMTALSFMADDENDLEFLLVPIVTLGHDSVTDESNARVNYFTVPQADGTSLRMDWWYIHRDSRFFQPIMPRIVPANELPALTPYPWHIRDRELLDEERDVLEEDGFLLIGETNIIIELDGDLPLEIGFMVAHKDTRKVLLIATDWDYPKRLPQMRIAEFVNVRADMYIFDIFKMLWDSGIPATLPADFVWSNQTLLADVAKALAGALGIPPRSVTIPVEVEDAPTEPPTEKEDD